MEKKKHSTRQTELNVKVEATLMPFLMDKMGGMTRTSVKQLLSNRRVQVNGHIETKHDYALNEGDKVVVSSNAGKKELKHPKLKIVYEDDDIIVVEKLCGLLTVATSLNSRETTAFSILKQYVRQAEPRAGVYVVHRLDRETSGLLVFARNQNTQQYMRDNWRQIVSQRIYVAVVEGLADGAHVNKDRVKISVNADGEYTLTSYLTENDATKRVYSSAQNNGGQLAVTHYRIVKHNEHHSLLELHLDTGRTNQIRVHMQSAGNPVVGDRKYGSGESSPLDRLALHARILEFRHPRTGRTMHFETPVPRKMLAMFHGK